MEKKGNFVENMGVVNGTIRLSGVGEGTDSTDFHEILLIKNLELLLAFVMKLQNNEIMRRQYNITRQSAPVVNAFG